jgi:hypothetical protein
MLRYATTILISMLVCTSCSFQSQTTVQNSDNVRRYQIIEGISGAKAGFATVRILTRLPGYTSLSKPSSTHGVYISSYLAQGLFGVFTSAITSINDQMYIIAGQTSAHSDEVYSLMSEYGAALQVDIPDMLNRSASREKALDVYTEALGNLRLLMERKLEELTIGQKTLSDQIKADKKIISTLEKEIEKAFEANEYETASSKQTEVTIKSGTLASNEVALQQNKDTVERFTELVQIGSERQNAIEANRRILISGLKVVDVPGIEEFELIEGR